MRAMVLEQAGTPLAEREIPAPEPSAGEIRVKINACAVCRTDLHIVDGDLKEPKLPLILGHEIIGAVDKLGSGASELRIGDRVGVPWLASTCGVCQYCQTDHENLCDAAQFTGYTRDGIRKD